MGPFGVEFPDLLERVTPPVRPKACPSQAVEVGDGGAYWPVHRRPVGLGIPFHNDRGVDNLPHGPKGGAFLREPFPGVGPPQD